MRYINLLLTLILTLLFLQVEPPKNEKPLRNSIHLYLVILLYFIFLYFY